MREITEERMNEFQRRMVEVFDEMETDIEESQEMVMVSLVALLMTADCFKLTSVIELDGCSWDIHLSTDGEDIEQAKGYSDESIH